MIDPFQKPQSVCNNDAFIMEQFVEYGHRGAELKTLNSFRMHLHVLCLSDLCTAGGQQITVSLLSLMAICPTECVLSHD
jgi:hypothetical protein